MSRGPSAGSESESPSDCRGKGGNQENDGCLEFGPSGRRRSKRVFRLRVKAWGLTRAVVCGPDGPAYGPSMKKGTHEMKKGPPFQVSSPFERIQASTIRKRTRLKRAPFDRSRSPKTVSRPKARKGMKTSPMQSKRLERCCWFSKATRATSEREFRSSRALPADAKGAEGPPKKRDWRVTRRSTSKTRKEPKLPGSRRENSSARRGESKTARTALFYVPRGQPSRMRVFESAKHENEQVLLLT